MGSPVCGSSRMRPPRGGSVARWLGGLGHARELATPRCPEICTIQPVCRVETRSRSLRVGWCALRRAACRRNPSPPPTRPPESPPPCASAPRSAHSSCGSPRSAGRSNRPWTTHSIPSPERDRAPRKSPAAPSARGDRPRQTPRRSFSATAALVPPATIRPSHPPRASNVRPSASKLMIVPLKSRSSARVPDATRRRMPHSSNRTARLTERTSPTDFRPFFTRRRCGQTRGPTSRGCHQEMPCQTPARPPSFRALFPRKDPIVQWLGHSPFTGVTRVRIPLGSLVLIRVCGRLA